MLSMLTVVCGSAVGSCFASLFNAELLDAQLHKLNFASFIICW